MEEKFIHNDIDFEACLIIAGLIDKPYATIEAQKRSEEFTKEQIQLIKERVNKR